MKFDSTTLQTRIPSPLGTIAVAATAKGLTGLWFTENQRYLPTAISGPAAWPEDAEHPLLQKVSQQLGEYFAGQRHHFDVALDLFDAEGGQPARLTRYADNCATLIDGMDGLGFKPFLPAALQAPIIVTFHAPQHAAYNFQALYQGVRHRGFILYPGKLTQVETFRVGCIGAIGANEMRQAVAAVADALVEMGIADGRSAG